MVSLTVADSVDHNEWHLPTFDPKNESKYHYKLHSLDIYFWTQQDALMFVNGVRRVLPASQVEILDEPGPPATGISSVVQKLETAAISNPNYASSTNEAGAGEPSAAHATFPGGIPPPPPPPVNTAPIAYNPAAPAAPEAMMHREKTPPPDEDLLNPLAVAVAHDYQKQPFTPGFPPQPRFPLGVASPGLPPNNLGSPGYPPAQFAGHPRQPALQRSATMPVNSSVVPSALNSQHREAVPGSLGYASPPAPPPSEPSSVSGQANAQLASPPPAAFSNYTYSPQNATQQGNQDYSLHQQLYRPSESEPKPHQYHPKQEARGKLEENAGRLERGVSGMRKKFEKKFG